MARLGLHGTLAPVSPGAGHPVFAGWKARLKCHPARLFVTLAVGKIAALLGAA